MEIVNPQIPENLGKNFDTHTFVSKKYIQTFKLTIKNLKSLVNMRLRTECPDSLEILNELNQKMLQFSEIWETLEQIFQEETQKQQNLQDLWVKSQKYDNLILRLDSIENTYRNNSEQLLEQIDELQKNIKGYKQKEIEHADNIEYFQIQLQEQKSKNENYQNEIELKNAEISRLQIEKDSIKRQQSNLSSLLKQVNEEKEVKNQQLGTDLEEKLLQVKGDLEKVKDSYNDKLSIKDQKIESLQRELKLAQNEIELNQEFTFLQSSVEGSKFQQNFYNNVATSQKKMQSGNKSNEQFQFSNSSLQNQLLFETQKNNNNTNNKSDKKITFQSPEKSSGYSSSKYSSSGKRKSLQSSGKQKSSDGKFSYQSSSASPSQKFSDSKYSSSKYSDD